MAHCPDLLCAEPGSPAALAARIANHQMTVLAQILQRELAAEIVQRMLWLNLPSAEKMKAAQYRDIRAAQIPRVELPLGGEVRVIAGTLSLDGKMTNGPVNGAGPKLTTDPSYFKPRRGTRSQ